MRSEATAVLLSIKEQLKENPFAGTTIDNAVSYVGNIADISLETLMRGLVSQPESSQNGEPQAEGFKDARIRRIIFKNFRAFPSDSYGLSFEKEESGKSIPQSVFLVGSNSNGKSTVCNALEYAYTGDIASARRLLVKREEYLTFGFGRGKVKKEDVKLTLRLSNSEKDVTIDLINPVRPYCTASCFCSELDVEELVKCDADISGFLMEQLGYGELPSLKARLNDMAVKIKQEAESPVESKLTKMDYKGIINAYLNVHYQKRRLKEVEKLTERSNFDALMDIIRNTALPMKGMDTKEATKAIREALPQIPSEHFQEEWDMLITNILLEDQVSLRTKIGKRTIPFAPGPESKEKKEEALQSKSSELEERLYQLYARLHKALKDETGLDRLYDDMSRVPYKGLIDLEAYIENQKKLLSFASAFIEIADKIDLELSRVKSIFYKNNKDFLSATMASFSPDSEVFELEYNSGKITARIRAYHGDFPCIPKEYYNTFRFKLYVIALKVTLAFLYMRSRKIVVPIVIDDVFNANDFDNSIKLERFVYSIYKAYEETVSSGIPLQLIVLTHDEMVQAAFRKGAKIMRGQEILTSNSSTDRMESRNFICGRLFHYTQANEIKKAGFGQKDFNNLYIEI